MEPSLIIAISSLFLGAFGLYVNYRADKRNARKDSISELRTELEDLRRKVKDCSQREQALRRENSQLMRQVLGLPPEGGYDEPTYEG